MGPDARHSVTGRQAHDLPDSGPAPDPGSDRAAAAGQIRAAERGRAHLREARHGAARARHPAAGAAPSRLEWRGPQALDPDGRWTRLAGERRDGPLGNHPRTPRSQAAPPLGLAARRGRAGGGRPGADRVPHHLAAQVHGLTMVEPRDRPGVIAPPPLLYLMAIVAGVSAQFLQPLILPVPLVARWLGGVLL